MSHLTGLRQAHAHPEAGRHAGGQRGGQRAAQARVDDLDTSDHRLHDQLAAEAPDAVDVLAHLTGGHDSQRQSVRCMPTPQCAADRRVRKSRDGLSDGRQIT